MIRYRTGNAEEGIAANSSARVLAVDANKNLLTIETRDGDQIAYDPAGLRAVTAKSTVYGEGVRESAAGERIRLTSALSEHGRNRLSQLSSGSRATTVSAFASTTARRSSLMRTRPGTLNTAMPLPMPEAFPPTG